MNIPRLVTSACGAMLAMSALGAHAQDYPSRPVTIVVPSTPGGGFDLTGRVIADALSKQMGKSFVVENRTGSGTLVGTQSVASAPPDGYTLLVGGLSNLVFNAGLYKAPKYDTHKDFTTIGMIGTNPYLLVARADLPVSTYQQLAQLMKAQPDKLTIATAGPGTGQHILASAFVKTSDSKLTVVPYRGAQPAYQDLLGGRVDLFIDAWPTVRPLLESKRVKVLFTTSAKRLPGLPDVPTAAEVGLPMLEVVSWYSLVAPAKTPPANVAVLRQAMAETLKDPSLASRLEKAGVTVTPMTLEAADRFMKADYDKWVGFIRQNGISAE